MVPGSAKDPLVALGLDSFKMSRLAVAIAHRFQVDIPVTWAMTNEVWAGKGLVGCVFDTCTVYCYNILLLFIFPPQQRNFAMGSLAQISSGAIRCSFNTSFRARFWRIHKVSGAGTEVRFWKVRGQS